jgi:hypothetical protein
MSCLLGNFGLEHMKTQSSLGCLLLVLGAFAATGCVASTDEAVGVAEEAALTSNALTSNALTSNALTSNALTSNALTSNALTSNALTSNALTSNALTSNALADPNARELLKYVVSCALPTGAQVVTPSGTYEGSLGLAPQWGKPGGHCDESCQEWVSACVLSRVDYSGTKVSISIRGQNKALATSAQEQSSFSNREATYYGNIFKSPQLRFACLSPGKTALPRVCGPSLDNCVMTITGQCDDVCERPTKDGAFRNCRAPVSDDDNCGDDDGTTFHGSVTVFLQ